MLTKALRRYMAPLPKKLPLRAVLILPFVLQILGAVGLVGYLSFRNGQRAVNDLASQLRSELTARIQQQIQSYVETPFLINQINATAFAQGDIQVAQAQGEYLLWQQANTFPSTNLIYCGTEADGAFLGVGHTGEDTVAIGLQISSPATNYYLKYYTLNSQGRRAVFQQTSDRPYDPRVRPWYKAAKAAGKPTWSEIYLDFDALVPVITASLPVYSSSNQLLGVCATDFFPAQELNTFLNNLNVGQSGETFIIERSGTLVASSTSLEESLLIGEGENTQRLQAKDSRNPLVQATTQYLLSHFGDFEKVQTLQQLNFKLADSRRQFVQVSPFQDGRGLDWLIVVVVPESDFMGQIYANTHLTILLCLIALAVAVGFGILTARWIVHPILKLNRASEAIASGTLDQTVEIQGIDELEALAASFNRMADQLRDSFETLEQRVEERTAELAESNHQLEISKEKAEVANQAKSTFIANMSHELRSPLNAVLGFSQLMIRSRSLPAEQQENAAIINRSGEYLLTLINNILDLSKIEAGKATFNPKNFDLHRLLSDLEDMLHLRADSKGLQLGVERGEDVPRYIKTDEIKLRQTLINLVSNAIKFTDRGQVLVRVSVATAVDAIESGSVRDAAHPAAIRLHFQVEDSGVGIPPEELPHLFEAFTQTQAGRDSQEGTGLGLAISRKFIQLMGGDLTVESQLGKGTRFQFNIDADLAESATEAKTRSQYHVLALEPGQPQYKILVVDDKAINRQLLVKLLGPLGFELKEAGNGQEAVEIWDQWEPHLIWMDMRMPILDGYEATKQIKATTKGQATAVIALTASVLEEERAVILSAGCDDFLRKPFREETIFDAMAKHLGVRYIYDPNTASPTPEVEIEHRDPTPDDLKTMPPEWITQLHEAALEADAEQVIQLVQTLPPHQQTLNQSITRWTHQFQFEKIISLTEPFVTHAE